MATHAPRLRGDAARITLLAVVLAGCPGGLDDPERFLLPPPACDGGQVCTTTTSTVPPLETVLRPRCGFAGCHAPPLPQSDLDLSSPGVEDRLISVTSSTALCFGRTFVVPGDPAQSLLYRKVTGMPPCGVSMPPGVGLEREEAEEIRLWIEAIGP